MNKLFETEESDIPNYVRLYKKTSTGAIQYWDVKCYIGNFKDGKGKRGVIEYGYGQFGTDNPQITTDHIFKGKNIGKQNETSMIEQMIIEAQAKWEKQKKKGYVESIEDAKAGKIDDIIAGGINPMLAHKFRDHSEKIKFPCAAQPKFDGTRMIGINKTSATLWSRTRKPISSLGHIQKEIEKIFFDREVILDGEAYNHDYKDRFEELISAIRKEEAHENSEIVQYHVYDIVSDEPYSERMKFLEKYIPKNNKFIKRVETVILNDETEVSSYYKKCMERGYEGCMLRNLNAPYEFKRSYSLQKVKKFDDAEFKVIGVEEGNGKLRGHVGAFVCITPQGKEFKAKMSGDMDKLKEYFENHKLWKNSKLTVQFQGWTNKEKVPRFPVGIRLRDGKD